MSSRLMLTYTNRVGAGISHGIGNGFGNRMGMMGLVKLQVRYSSHKKKGSKRNVLPPNANPMPVSNHPQMNDPNDPNKINYIPNNPNQLYQTQKDYDAGLHLAKNQPGGNAAPLHNFPSPFGSNVPNNVNPAWNTIENALYQSFQQLIKKSDKKNVSKQFKKLAVTIGTALQVPQNAHNYAYNAEGGPKKIKQKKEVKRRGVKNDNVTMMGQYDADPNAPLNFNLPQQQQQRSLPKNNVTMMGGASNAKVKFVNPNKPQRKSSNRNLPNVNNSNLSALELASEQQYVSPK